MMNEKDITHISKLLSLVLRHKPDTIGITLNEQGWTDVDILLQQLNKHGHRVTLSMLQQVVETNTKKRFSFNEDGRRIKANQGHSVEVELALEAKEPPSILYHGTAERSLDSIMKTGLDRRERHHVHLSENKDTAIDVGRRYGKPVLLVIDSNEMYKDGYQFYVTANNVWLTDHVPVKYLQRWKG
jgi:putative RNA 2'-phosphotransferase